MTRKYIENRSGTLIRSQPQTDLEGWTTADITNLRFYPRAGKRILVERKDNLRFYMEADEDGFLHYLLYPKAAPLSVGQINRWKLAPKEA